VACRASHIAVVLQLRDHVTHMGQASASSDYVNTRNAAGETSLHAACHLLSTEPAAALLQSGADVSLDTFQVGPY